STHLNDPDVVVLHVGTDAVYRAGHIAGARFIAVTTIAPERNGTPFELADTPVLEAAFEAAGVSDRSHVVIYTDAGILQAARAFFTLDYVGHRRVSLLDGGLDIWKLEGRPLNSEVPTVATGSLTVRAQADRLVTADWLNQRLQDPAIVLLDARTSSEYSGQVPGSFAPPRPGHIPGAYNLFWRDMVLSATDQRLKDRETLRAAYAAVGATAGKRVVSSCITGVLSSVNYFVARYLGLDVSLYDGSFLEWSRRPELPVAKCASRFCA
ncbi:MAG: sulfurtransferase, partial [Gemmatimonadaceae bacterium]